MTSLSALSSPPLIVARNRPDLVYAWRGTSLFVTDTSGRSGDMFQTGYFYRETRYLRHLRLQINGADPFLCSVAECDYNRIEFSYVYPEGPAGEGSKEGIPFRGLDMRLTAQVRSTSLDQTVVLTSYNADIEFDLKWHVSADFADINEAEGDDRQQNANVLEIPQPNGVRFRYCHPDLPMQTSVTIGGHGTWTYENSCLRSHFRMARFQTITIKLSVSPVDYEDFVAGTESAHREAQLDSWMANLTAVETVTEQPFVTITNQALRCVGSFAMLEGEDGEWLAPAAAVPLYPIFFGRDATTISYQISAFDRGWMAEDAVRRLARLQGSEVNDYRDEEPGRIIYQARSGPLSRLGLNPHKRYYADYASPFDLIFALGHAYTWIGQKNTIERHWDTIRRIMDWARDFGDKDGDGYLEYLTKSEKGPRHQGWKDSFDAAVRSDGSQVSAPIATCEVQAYYYMALRIVAALSGVLGHPSEGLAYWRMASKLKEKFNQDFWIERENCIAFGLDADKRQIDTVSSNAGCFVTGILDDERMSALVTRLFQPDMFSGWGIRTLSSKNPAYNPLSYHLGSVWPVENATIVLGLRRYGFNEEAARLTRALYDLALVWKGSQIPECVGGYPRSAYAHPGAFPRANVPQAWNQSSFPLMLHAMLGLQPLATINTLAVDPDLPEWLPEVTLRNLRLGEAVVDLKFSRNSDGKSKAEVARKQGAFHLLHQAPMGSFSAGTFDRLGWLVKDLF